MALHIPLRRRISFITKMHSLRNTYLRLRWGRPTQVKYSCAAFNKPAANYKCNIPQPELDVEYLCNIDNKHEIESNITSRKGVGDINRVHELYSKLQSARKLGEKEQVVHFLREFNEEAKRIPNKSSNLLKSYGDTPSVTNKVGLPKNYGFKPKEFSDLAKHLRLLRTEDLGNLTGHRSYYLLGDLAELEQALIQFTVQSLLQKKFQLVSVPDILHSNVVESCGMSTKGDRTQVYKLDPTLYGEDLCLSGTSEMALAGFLTSRVFVPSELPLRLAAVSRCYRAETSSLAEEKGIFRVHQFTKVEMFGVTRPECSADLLEEFCSIQEQNFACLGLHFHRLDMPCHELGAPAYRKFDVEAWMPGRRMFGEVSSSSDCTDYQSRRLGIKYLPGDDRSAAVHAHTVNGTACAVPRMLIALMETHQRADGTVDIPGPLQRFMGGKQVIGKQEGIPQMKPIKSKDMKRN